ncbi:hypothetical protein ACFPM7_21060 [Actinokineospora guangxiensis]|uniref:Uncharacterized protein n=1 Tax=Actinokineospora guangxiensis TaxID=1490288 RepID=A0ABW0EUG1_9PSEU
MRPRTDAPMAPLLSGIAENTRTERARAARTIAVHARDADELRDLLAMLGLTPHDAAAVRGESAA